jgi:hypothetical protein
MPGSSSRAIESIPTACMRKEKSSARSRKRAGGGTIDPRIALRGVKSKGGFPFPTEREASLRGS